MAIAVCRRKIFLSLAEKLLEIGSPIIAEAIRQEVATGGVVEDMIDGHPCVFLLHLHRAEQAIAGAILKLQAGAPPWPTMDADKALAWVEGKLGVTLASGQRVAVGTALGAKLAVITGGPGVGRPRSSDPSCRSSKQRPSNRCSPRRRGAPPSARPKTITTATSSTAISALSTP